MKDPVIIYHADCPDGFGGAWAAWKKFGTKATYLPTRHQNPPPEGLSGKTVYMIDFSYPRDVMPAITRQARRTIIIDHHKMAESSANLADEKSFDIKHSGATLAWKYFHPAQKTPRLLLHIEDSDIWKFTVPGTHEVSAFMELIPFEFGTWDRLARDFENPVKRKALLARGKTMLEYKDGLVKRIAGKALRISWHGKTHLAVNSPFFASELGHELAKMSPSKIAVVWHRASDGIKVSLRSTGNVDVAKLAKKYGGGGHPKAAAFRIKKGETLPWKIIS